jgi:hypothetical protein
MALTAWIALWGAFLSTVLAILQIVNHLRDQPRLVVTAEVRYGTLSESEADTARGTPVQVQRGHDVLLEEMLVELKIVNRGRRPIQIVAVVVEDLVMASDDDEPHDDPAARRPFVHVHEVVPAPLPTMIDP